jgi:uncharacterized membrane-anchored protein YjiN (DUF445 family)
MTGAVEKIEKIKKGLSKDKKVADALRLANESVNEAANKIADIRKILKTKKGKRIDSIFMDVETAEEVMKHYKSLGRGAKERLTKQKIQNIVKSVKKANESVNEEVTKGKAVQKIFDIYENGYGKLGGRMLDSLSAGLFVQLYNKAPDKIKQKMDKMNEKRLYVVIGKMWDKFGKGVTLS